jgi:hypothetical protein
LSLLNKEDNDLLHLSKTCFISNLFWYMPKSYALVTYILSDNYICHGVQTPD